MSAKTDGQEVSASALSAATWDNFRRVLECVPIGAMFTVNGLHVLLEMADIPTGARGALFARAARAGMMRPAMSGPYTLMEPSLGSSAKGAGVRVYRRAS